jgi:tRNA pseudouridine13 synthase
MVGEALAFESSIIEQDADIARGLENFGLKHERRAMFVYPGDLMWQSHDDGLKLAFSLPAGSYATSVLRELAIIEDASTKQS